MVACCHFSDGDALQIYNREWMYTEIIELVGMSFLVLSYIPKVHSHVLALEICAYSGLIAAALVHVTPSVTHLSLLPFQSVSLQLDIIHLTDIIGLSIITIVAVCGFEP